MKKSVWILFMMCVPALAMAQSADDDLYFNPNKKTSGTQTVSTTTDTTTYNAPISTVVVKDVKGNVRDVDEYNRRYTSRDNNFSMENDTLYIEEKPLNERGEWVNGFEGSQADYEYTMRFIRFRNPRYAIPMSSPLYWEVISGALPSWDWNVYDDGLYAYIFPTYTNPLWWDWRWNYSIGWGWYSPWYYSWYYPYYWGGLWGGYWSGLWGGWYRPHYAWGGAHWAGLGHGLSRPAWYDTRRGETRIQHSAYAANSRNALGGRTDRSSYRTASRTGNDRVAGRVVNSDRVAGSNTRSVRPSSGTASRGTTGSTYSSDRTRPTTNYTRPSISDRCASYNSRPSSTRSSVRTGNGTTTYQRSNNTATQRTSTYSRNDRSSFSSSRSSLGSGSSSSSRSSFSSGAARSSGGGGGGGARRR